MTGTTDGKLWRRPKTGGGEPQAIADCGETTRLVFYGPDLYWADARLNRIAVIERGLRSARSAAAGTSLAQS